MNASSRVDAEHGHATVAGGCAEAISCIRDGMTVAVGGSINSGHPMALVRALIQRAAKDLTIVCGFGSMDIDMLVGSGAVRRLVAAFVGVEGVSGVAPLLRWACEGNRIEAWDLDEGVLLTALRAAAQRVPYATWRCGLGTDATANPLCELVGDAWDGKPYLKVRPLPVDVCLYWAEAADVDGNVLRWGADFGDPGLAAASAVRIVQVERIVPARLLEDAADRVAPWQADIVVSAPLGTYPFAGSAIDDDLSWLSSYLETMAALHRDGDWDRVAPTIARLLCLDGGEHAFLESVGVARLRELMA
ncbi:MAG: CoA transferase subunit A [Lautropia sp.]